MKNTTLLLFITLLFQGIGQSNYENSLLKHRVEANAEMKNEVLSSEEREKFEGICYFPIDSSYLVTATFERKKGKKFKMPMTKERTVYYRTYGILHFTIRDTVCQLIVYENLSLKHVKGYENYLFLPFRDGTTAISTYGGGRYVDLYKQKGTNWKIDFNYSYHPYCVYSAKYSCPIPPKENVISPYISAGECYHHNE